ncbi:MAG: S24 family peptidase [Sneathiella sp.]
MTPKLSVLSENIRKLMYEMDVRTYKALEIKAGVATDSVRNLLSGRTKSIRSEKLEPIAAALGVTVENLIRDGRLPSAPDVDDIVRLPRYDIRLAAGAGAFPDIEQVVDHIPFNRKWLKSIIAGSVDQLAVVEVDGDSMEPALRSKDEVLINLADTSLMDGGICAILMNDTLVIKRVFLSPTGLEIRSDNPHYPSWAISGEGMDSLKILGRAVIRVGRL